MSIKIIEGMADWEVMKAASEGKRVAARNEIPPNFAWIEQSTPAFAWDRNEYAIIDESQPSIDWGGFDWDFFIHDRALTVMTHQGGSSIPCLAHTPPRGENVSLRPSPLYPWTGGECPVPGNCEVEITLRCGVKFISKAGIRGWGELRDRDREIIHFRLTGEVL